MTVVSSADEMFGPPPLEPDVEPAAPSALTEDHAPPSNDVPRTSSTSTAAAATPTRRLSVTSPDAVVFSLMTPAAWALIEQRASRRTHPDWNDPYAVARFTESLKWNRGVLSLTELSDAMGIAPDFARPYLRALHTHLRAEGIEIRERRLAGDGQLGTHAKYLGEFMWPQEKNAMYQERAALKRAVVKAKALTKREEGLDSGMALQKAQDALAECEIRVAEMVKTTEHLPVERHAFIVVLDAAMYAPVPTDEAASA